MRRTYIFLHWGLTLLLAPFTSQAILYIWGTNPRQVVGLLEVYPITLIFSILFSLPTFIVYLTSFYILSKYNISSTISKLILVGIAVLGVFVTMTIIKGSMSQDITIAYCLTAFVVGLSLKLKTVNLKAQNKSIMT
ncbi:hypothetical protein [Lacibacter sp. H407]|uniref:hypothetical protein n=1 Tax=Lacibacter sp. H407 TaxID=3133423 RepID=UPI0030BB2F6C